jgi:hypothetical protein
LPKQAKKFKKPKIEIESHNDQTLRSNISLTTRFLSPQMSSTQSFGGDFFTTGIRSPLTHRISQAELKQ